MGGREGEMPSPGGTRPDRVGRGLQVRAHGSEPQTRCTPTIQNLTERPLYFSFRFPALAQHISTRVSRFRVTVPGSWAQLLSTQGPGMQTPKADAGGGSVLPLLAGCGGGDEAPGCWNHELGGPQFPVTPG